MRSDRRDAALRDILHHIGLANRFLAGFDEATFGEDTRTIPPPGPEGLAPGLAEATARGTPTGSRI